MHCLRRDRGQAVERLSKTWNDYLWHGAAYLVIAFFWYRNIQVFCCVFRSLGFGWQPIPGRTFDFEGVYFDIFPGFLCDGLTKRGAEGWRARNRQSDGVDDPNLAS